MSYLDQEYVNTKIDELLDLARAELGVKEDAGKDEDLDGRIKLYRASVTFGDVDPYRGPEAWCADFVSWCFLMIGHPLGDEGKGFRSCANMMHWFEENYMFFHVGDDEIRPGDVVFIDGNNNYVPDHVGLVEKVLDHQHIVTIEGNYGNKCTRVNRTNFSIIMGFAFGLE